MAGCGKEHDRTVTKHVVIALDDFRLAFLQSSIRGVDLFYVWSEHHVVVTLVHEKGCTRKITSVADVIDVRMRHRQIGDLRGGISYLFQLAFQRLCHEHKRLKRGRGRRVAQQIFIEWVAKIAIAKTRVK